MHTSPHNNQRSFFTIAAMPAISVCCKSCTFRVGRRTSTVRHYLPVCNANVSCVAVCVVDYVTVNSGLVHAAQLSGCVELHKSHMQVALYVSCFGFFVVKLSLFYKLPSWTMECLKVGTVWL